MAEDPTDPILCSHLSRFKTRILKPESSRIGIVKLGKWPLNTVLSLTQQFYLFIFMFIELVRLFNEVNCTSFPQNLT